MCSSAIGHPNRILKCSPEGEGVFPSHRMGHKSHLSLYQEPPVLIEKDCALAQLKWVLNFQI